MFQKLRKLDERVVERMSQIHRPVLDKVMVLFTYAGTGGFIWWILFILPFLISRTFRQTGIILTAAIGFNYVLGEIVIKKMVGRDRPSTLIADEDMKIKRPKDHSFPSGHSASSFCAFAVTMWCCPVWICLPALLLAGTIAFSRMYLRVHYLTDVLGGVVLGMLDGSLMTLFFRTVVFTQA